MKILYKNILNLELWHDFYLGQPNPPPGELPANYNISTMLSLVPTVDCQQVLRNLRWVFRTQPSGASLFASVDEATIDDATSDATSDATPRRFQTVVPIDRPYRLTFWLKVRDRNFANYTNLALTNHRHQIYYFSNLWGNQGHARFLTQPLAAYTTNATYSLGQLIIHNNQTLEALQPQDTVDSTPDPAAWDILPASQYVSEGDRLPKQGRYRTQTIGSTDPGDAIQFRLLDSNRQESFTADVTAPDSHGAGQALPVHLDLTGLLPGRYQLLQDGTLVDEFVFTDLSDAQDAFALVEILLNPALIAPAFSLLQIQNGQTLIQPQTYVIRFKNRATRWRYRYQQPHGCSAATLPDVFTLIDANTYATTRPIGLRQRPNALLNGCKDKPLPSPSAGMIKPEINENQQIAHIFSDVYL